MSGAPVDPHPPGEHDAVAPLVGLAGALRAAGVTVGTGDVVTFACACARLGPRDATDVYWAGRACLIHRAEDLATYDRVFAERAATAGQLVSQPTAPQSTLTVTRVRADHDEAGEADSEDDSGVAGVAASDLEVLRTTRFDRLDDAERARVHRLLAAVRVGTPQRRTRRTMPARRGRHGDLRRSLRAALRTDGELMRTARRARRRRWRRLVLLLDVSRSMTEFSRALLVLGHAAARGPAPVEAFCFGTRLTRVTDVLALRDPDAALNAVADRVPDWDGGTRIGDALHDFLARGGRAGLARGAVIVICSDGLERGDPQALATAIARLHRLAHRLVWVNPLTGDPRYEPRAAGMAAALPHVDDFRAGHDLASLEALAQLLTHLADPDGDPPPHHPRAGVRQPAGNPSTIGG